MGRWLSRDPIREVGSITWLELQHELIKLNKRLLRIKAKIDINEKEIKFSSTEIISNLMLYDFVSNNSLDNFDLLGLRAKAPFNPVGVLVELANKLSDALINSCKNIECKEPCDTCCSVGAISKSAALSAGYAANMAACSALTGIPFVGPVLAGGCMALATADLADATSILGDAISECNNNCSSKPSTEPPDCCGKGNN